MLRVLIKKQFSEILFALSYDRKKGRRRSPVAAAASFGLVLLVWGGSLVGVFTLLSFYLCFPLIHVNVLWLYHCIMGLLSLLLGVSGCVFSSYSGVYLAKDNDLLLAMPIPVSTVLAARLVTVYLLALLYSGAVSIPSVIVPWILGRFSLTECAASLGWVFLLSLLTMVISLALGWLVAKIMTGLKHRSLIAVLACLILVAGYYSFFFNGQLLVNEIRSNPLDYARKIQKAASWAYLIGRAPQGDFLVLLALLAAALLLFFGVFMVLRGTFLRIVIATSRAEQKGFDGRIPRARRPGLALLFKELRRFFKSPAYMLSCGIGILMLPLAGLLFYLKGELFIQALRMYLSRYSGCVPVLACALICLLSSMNNMAAPSVSLEGKSLKGLKALPVRGLKALMAKLGAQLLLTLIPAFFCSAGLLASMHPSRREVCVILFYPPVYIFFNACLCLALGLLMANVHWKEEMVPLRQSLPTYLTLIGGWLYCICFIGFFFIRGYRDGLLPYVTAFGLGTLLAGLLLFLWICLRGERRFEAL